MPKKIAKAHHVHKTLNLSIQIIGSLLILIIFTAPFFFYTFQGIAYLPSIQYVLVGLGSAAVIIYSYLLTLTIKSRGKYVVILVNILAAILLSVVLLIIFTPFVNYAIAKAANIILCDRIPELVANLPPRLGASLQDICTTASYKYIFGQQ